MAILHHSGSSGAPGPKVEYIGKAAFSCCSALSSLNLAEVKTIGYGAFSQCEALTSVNLPKAEQIANSAFYSCSALSSLNLPKVKTIDEQAFYQCSSLTSLNLPEAQTIGMNAFFQCKALTSINLLKVKTIDKSAFYECSALTSVSLPEVEHIGFIAFYECRALSTLNLPKVKKIDQSFYNSEALTIITLHQQTRSYSTSFPETLNLNYLCIEGITKETCIKEVYEKLPESLQNQNIILNKDEQIKQLFFTKNALDITNPVGDVNNTIMDFSKRLCFFKRKESKNNGELPTETPVLLAN